MSNVTSYVEDKQTSEFYPTPEKLVQKMLGKVKWEPVQTILEPSAGKGDIVRGIAMTPMRDYQQDRLDVDCIEIDQNLRAILKYSFSEEAKREILGKKAALIKTRASYEKKQWDTGRYTYYDEATRTDKPFPDREQFQLEQYDRQLNGFIKKGIHVVHDDFLTYTPYKHYDLIVMNPPFSCGARHLLKAIEMQQSGGQIVCLLNAETLRNPYTAERKRLAALLEQYGAEIEYIEDAFTDAERRAVVDTALISIQIPFSADEGRSLFDQIARAKQYSDPDPEEHMEIEVTDMIQMIVNRYRTEIEAGLELLRIYRRMLPHLNRDLNEKGYPIIYLTNSDHREITVNEYVKSVRLKYWEALLKNEKFVGKLTSKLQTKYRERVRSYSDYDFSEFNIYALLAEMNAEIKTGIEDEIGSMYDRLTEEHSFYPECSKNKHLYDGWKTNKAWKIDKKCILPCYGVYDQWDYKPRKYEAYNVLSDIERILNFFDGNMTADVDLSSTIEQSFSLGITKNVKCKFFDATFYKKGTVHIVFTCPELIDRFNIYAAQQRGWLPPSYGKKQYKDMDAEEKAVVDSFQGAAAYAKVMQNASYYLAAPVKAQNLLGMGEGV
jgi:16S rRNA A1518/A1519 N6-dimethyltransferase RsmA/KsgA/DIM1 with predicted DNA glycosylase/AP lyase activity